MPRNPDADLTQPVGTDVASESPPVMSDAAAPAVPTPGHAAPTSPAPVTGAPAWASSAHEGDGSASARPVPLASPAPPVTQGHPVAASGAVPVDGAKKSWRSRFSHGRGLVVGALVVGLGLGAVGGSAGTWAVTHDNATGTTADGTSGFDRGRDGSFGPPGGRGGMPPGGGQAPDGTQQDGGTTGQLPGGGAGTDGSTGQQSGGGTGTDGSTGGSTDANGAAETT